MPILDVELVLPTGASMAPGLPAAIADAAASVFGSRPGQTWVRLHELPRERYAENGGGPEGEIQPVFVRVLKAAVPRREELRTEMAALAAAIARVCHRPIENVHVVYDPPAAGRIGFGGEWVEGA